MNVQAFKFQASGVAWRLAHTLSYTSVNESHRSAGHSIQHLACFKPNVDLNVDDLQC